MASFKSIDLSDFPFNFPGTTQTLGEPDQIAGAKVHDLPVGTGYGDLPIQNISRFIGIVGPIKGAGFAFPGAPGIEVKVGKLFRGRFFFDYFRHTRDSQEQKFQGKAGKR
jgi:hypothetical protein